MHCEFGRTRHDVSSYHMKSSSHFPCSDIGQSSATLAFAAWLICKRRHVPNVVLLARSATPRVVDAHFPMVRLSYNIIATGQTMLLVLVLAPGAAVTRVSASAAGKWEPCLHHLEALHRRSSCPEPLSFLRCPAMCKVLSSGIRLLWCKSS